MDYYVQFETQKNKIYGGNTMNNIKAILSTSKINTLNGNILFRVFFLIHVQNFLEHLTTNQNEV